MPTILGDHRKRGRRLVPPLLQAMEGKYQPFSWVREILPEFVWLHFLFEVHGLKRGVELAIEVALAAKEVFQGDKEPLFCRISSFSVFAEEEYHQINSRLSSVSQAEISLALAPLAIIIPDNPLSFLVVADECDLRVASYFGEMLARLYDRHSKEASWVNATAFYIGVVQGRIKLAEHVAVRAKEALDHIHEYPHTEESKAAGAFFRAGAPMHLSNLESDTVHDTWLQVFWHNVAGMGPCINELKFSPEPLPEDDLGHLIFSYRNAVRSELYYRVSVWGFDLNSIEQYELLGALLSRQTTLAAELAASPNMWTSHCAPVILRAMADVHITVAWVLGDPVARSKRYVDDGLGAIKLEIEHRKANLAIAQREDPDELKMLEQLIDFWEAWLSSQRLDQLVEVNLGSWSGTNTRKMAEEAGCLPFYNFVYQPFSAAVHSTWPHVSTKNLTYCENPAHRFHRLPLSSDEEYDVYWLYLAAKYAEKTFSVFDEATSVKCASPKAIDILLDQIKREDKKD